MSVGTLISFQIEKSDFGFCVGRLSVYNPECNIIVKIQKPINIFYKKKKKKKKCRVDKDYTKAPHPV